MRTKEDIRKIFEDEDLLPEEFSHKMKRTVLKKLETIYDLYIQRIKEAYQQFPSQMELSLKSFYAVDWLFSTAHIFFDDYNDEDEDMVLYNSIFLYLDNDLNLDDSQIENIVDKISFSLGTVKEIIEIELPEIYEKTKWQYENSLFDIFAKKEVPMKSEREIAEYAKSRFSQDQYPFNVIKTYLLCNKIHSFPVSFILRGIDEETLRKEIRLISNDRFEIERLCDALGL